MNGIGTTEWSSTMSPWEAEEDLKQEIWDRVVDISQASGCSFAIYKTQMILKSPLIFLVIWFSELLSVRVSDLYSTPRISGNIHRKHFHYQLFVPTGQIMAPPSRISLTRISSLIFPPKIQRFANEAPTRTSFPSTLTSTSLCVLNQL